MKVVKKFYFEAVLNLQEGVLDAIRERCGGAFIVGVRMVGMAARDNNGGGAVPGGSSSS